MAVTCTVVLTVPIRAGRVLRPAAAKPGRQPFKVVAAAQQPSREWRLAAAVCHIWRQRSLAQQQVLEVVKVRPANASHVNTAMLVTTMAANCMPAYK
jgi:hypothetical protein